MIAAPARWPMIPRSHLLVLAGAAALLCAHTAAYFFVGDDAYISFRYAHNFAHHGQLVFNLGDRVEGYSNFLWTVLLAGLLKLGLRLDVMSHVLGLACGIAVQLQVYALARALRDDLKRSHWDLLAPILLSVWGGFAVWCTSGLETQLFSALVVAGVASYIQARKSPLNKPWCIGLFFSLAAMTRPEGLFFFALTIGHMALTQPIKVAIRAIAAASATFCGIFGPYLLWRHAYYGYWLPNTFYIKGRTAGQDRLDVIKDWGLSYLGDFIVQNGIYVVLVLVVIAIGVHIKRKRPSSPVTLAWTYLALLVGAHTLYVVSVGGDFMAMGRFFAPILPYMALASAASLRTICARTKTRAVGVSSSAALIVFAATCSWAAYQRNQKLSYDRPGIDTIAYLKKFADDRIVVGNWMRRFLPADTYLAVGGAGAIVYASQLRALDTFGLNNAWIAHNVPATNSRPGHGKFAPESYILQQRPDLMCHMAHHQDTPYQAPSHDAAYWQQRGYAWVCIDPQGLTPAYYCCLKRIGKQLGPFAP